MCPMLIALDKQHASAEPETAQAWMVLFEIIADTVEFYK